MDVDRLRNFPRPIGLFPAVNDGRNELRKICYFAYGIEWPLLVWTDCRSGLSTIPLRLRSSRKLAAVTGWFLSVLICCWSGLSTMRLAFTSAVRKPNGILIANRAQQQSGGGSPNRRGN